MLQRRKRKLTEEPLLVAFMPFRVRAILQTRQTPLELLPLRLRPKIVIITSYILAIRIRGLGVRLVQVRSIDTK